MAIRSHCLFFYYPTLSKIYMAADYSSHSPKPIIVSYGYELWNQTIIMLAQALYIIDSSSLYKPSHTINQDIKITQINKKSLQSLVPALYLWYLAFCFEQFCCTVLTLPVYCSFICHAYFIPVCPSPYSVPIYCSKYWLAFFFFAQVF